MKKVIVTTTINNPTKAIDLFESMEDWELVVIGDKKTPNNYKLRNGLYIPPEEQEAYDKPLSDAIGWNCIQRRNFGLLWAHDMKADIVAVVDDDNHFVMAAGSSCRIECEHGFKSKFVISASNRDF